MVTQIDPGGSGHGNDRDAGDDEDTRIIFPGGPRSGHPDGSDETATRLIPGRQVSGSEPRGRVIGVAPTAISPAPAMPRSQDAEPASDHRAHIDSSDLDSETGENTILIPSSRRSHPSAESDAADASSGGRAAERPLFDPAVGFLVIVDGPGRGMSHPIHYGQNSIGRSSSQRISLNHGDPRISREDHAFLIYDDATQEFFIRDNGKANLVRHNDMPVLTPTRLIHRDVISIGDTLMLFIAVCGNDFDWIRDDPERAFKAQSTDLGATGHEPTGD